MNKNTLKAIIIGGLLLVPFVPFLVYSNLFFPFITSKAFTWRIIVEVIFACWIVLASIDKEYRPNKSIILYALSAFVVAIGISDLFGVAPIKSFWSNYERMEGYITLLHLEAFFIVLISVMREKNWKTFWNTSLVASFLMTLYCFAQLLGLTAINQGGVRVDGTLGNAAYLAVYMLFHIFLAILFIAREHKGSMMKWVYGTLIFCQVVVLYNTATRGAILGLIGGLILVSILNIRNKESKSARRNSLATLGLILVLIGGFYAVRNAAFVKKSPVLQRFAVMNISSVKTEGRSFIWPMAVRGIMERPILGWGQENFNYVFNQFYDPKMYNLEPWFDRAHNIFLDWGIAGGFVGLALYLSLYVVLLISIWKRDDDMHYIEKSILTGLIAGYFFHNLFVFDQLISYILFVSLLAYVHTRSTPIKEMKNSESADSDKFVYASAGAVVGLVLIMYFVNIKPIIANTSLIDGLQAAQSDQSKGQTLSLLRESFETSRLGRPETVEWISSSADGLLRSSLSQKEKEDYFQFAKSALEQQINELPTDARYQIIAGSFFAKTGNIAEAMKYLNKAKELSPGKQAVYFELGALYINNKEYEKGLEEFKQAYDLAPEYREAQIMYMAAAIYANRSDLVSTIAKMIPLVDIVKDSRITDALVGTGRYDDAQNLMNEWINFEPNNSNAYLGLTSIFLKQGNKAKAIEVLQVLETKIPSTKEQVDGYIKGIQDGTLK